MTTCAVVAPVVSATAVSAQAGAVPLEFHPRPGAFAPEVRNPGVVWTRAAVQALFDMPWMELMWRAQQVHYAHWPVGEMELATLLSVKTGGCPENCGYCPQSQSFDTGMKAGKLMEVDEVLQAARAAQSAGATRFCMGAAWRAPKDRDIEKISALVQAVKGLGMQTCATLGMLAPHQAQALREAGLDYYNHNLDTSPEHYANIVSTRDYQARLDTLRHVREAGIKVCCGGIVGMGEQTADRAALVAQLANLDPYPESVPINSLVRVPGTPLENADPVDPLDFVRMVAVCRITMPRARIRMSAGRREMGEAVQALCFLAGANSIFYGDKLLVTGNPDADADRRLLDKLGMRAHHTQTSADAAQAADAVLAAGQGHYDADAAHTSTHGGCGCGSGGVGGGCGSGSASISASDRR